MITNSPRVRAERFLNAAVFERTIRMDPEGLQSDAVVDAARRHGTGPLAFLNAKRGNVIQRLPPDVAAALRMTYVETLCLNQDMRGALCEIDDAVAAVNEPVIVMRGIPLLDELYRDPGARPVTDLDLLVRPGRLRFVSDLLVDHGFRRVDARHLARGSAVVVDLHDDPVDAARIPTRATVGNLDVEALWRRTRPAARFPALLVFENADRLLLGAAHALKHGFGRTIWLSDLVRLAEAVRQEDAWDTFQSRARETRMDAAYTCARIAVEARTGCTLPDLHAARRPSGLLRLAVARAGAEEAIEPLYLLRAADSWACRWRAFVEFMAPADPQLRPAADPARSRRFAARRVVTLATRGLGAASVTLGNSSVHTPKRAASPPDPAAPWSL